MDLKDTIRSIPDFPVKGVLFRDVTTLFKDGAAFRELVGALVKSVEGMRIDLVAAPEARGFVLGAAMAYELGVGFVPARKPGKLPCETVSYTYALEYGTDTLHIHADAIQPGMHILVVDDLLATGGTALAVIRLCERMGAKVAGARFAIELEDLKGREKLRGYDVDAPIKYPVSDSIRPQD